MVAFECAAAALTLGDHDLARKLIERALDDRLHTSLDDGGSSPLVRVARRESRALLISLERISRRRWRQPRDTPWSSPSCEPVRRSCDMISDLPDAHSALARRILRRAQALASPSLGSELVEPLTDRELEILSYLPSRLTNTELADHFYVSVNTVKTHMAHIYRKLGVANRNGAIFRAREIGSSPNRLSGTPHRRRRSKSRAKVTPRG